MVAIIDAEPGFETLTAQLARERHTRISAATLVEIHAVIYRRGKVENLRRAQRLLEQFDVETVPLDADQSRIAGEAYRDYGRGSGHLADLNLGDCFSYALAIARDEPLLFVGDDFTHTDVRVALKR
ncbi:type II toxin-antitoxin system VapC family toxin [Demequina sp. NBRC 110056]|uniref:type II toxin-antitoxin system VapC family toxin n=1 Tax=Demequina sp. NBRC 110056 TaxID=1570345 RepID=UPI001F38F37D|nr:type II toxin-antitoxin system VapC family toxin [Demequina sp. NBRC 110056]